MAATFLNQKNVDPVLYSHGQIGGAPPSTKGFRGAPCPLLLHI